MLKLALALMLTTSAWAQSTIQVVAPKAGMRVSSTCSDWSGKVLDTVLSLEHPQSWTYYVICDQPTWERTKAQAGSPDTEWAFTDIERKFTVVNAQMFSASAVMRTGWSPRFAIAHELGHIALKTKSEEKANAWARVQLTRSQ
jgi:hypothetical protein